jgi:hypothetical protein
VNRLNRQYNGQKRKSPSNDLQNTTQKIKDLATPTPLKTTTSGNRHVIFVTNPQTSHE